MLHSMATLGSDPDILSSDGGLEAAKAAVDGWWFAAEHETR